MLDVCDEYNCIGMEMPLLLCRRRLSPTLIPIMAAEWVRVLRAAERFTLFVQWSPAVTRFSNFCSAARGGLAVCQNSPLKTNGNCLENYANFWCHMSQALKHTATGGLWAKRERKGCVLWGVHHCDVRTSVTTASRY